MHDTALHIGVLAMKNYSDLATASILEIGAQNVNGSLRSGALPTTNYVGIDLEEGDGVDIVSAPGDEWPVADDHFDLVMASSVFEHDKVFWRTFLQMCRKAKPGGFIYISAPSNGKVHRYPRDFWRFYPDAGLALEELARSEGIDLKLVESFIAERQADEWNDFCAIFRRGPSEAPLPDRFIWQQVACTNALTWQSAEIQNARDNTEDQIFLGLEKENVAHLQRVIDNDRAAWNAEREALARTAAEIKIEAEKSGLLLTEAHARSDREAKAREEVDTKLAELRRELQNREHRIAALESNLRQRQEEIAQAWAQVEVLKGQAGEIDELKRTVAEAEEWVFKLAGERRQAEQLSEKYERELLKLREQLTAEEWRSVSLSAQIGELTQARSRDACRLKTSRKQIAQVLDRLRENEVELARLQGELSSLGDAHRETEQIASESQRVALARERQLQWLKQVTETVRRSTPGWRGFLPQSWRRRRQLNALHIQGLFDAGAYLDLNPDVREAGIDPLNHYISHGMAEGRQAGITLD